MARGGTRAGVDWEPWLLLTDWPVTDAQSAVRIFTMYRQRWSVEIVQSQMTKTHLLGALGGRDHVTDLYLLVGHHDAVNEQLDQLPFLLKGGIRQSLLHTLTKRFDGLHHRGQLIVVPDTGFQLACLFSDTALSSLQLLSPPLELVQSQHLGQIGIGEPSICCVRLTRALRRFSRRACSSWGSQCPPWARCSAAAIASG